MKPERTLLFPCIALGALAFMLALPARAAERSFTNFQGAVFIEIPAGTFWMGNCSAAQSRSFLGLSAEANAAAGEIFTPDMPACGDDDWARSNEMPRRNVRVSAFGLARTEVTRKQFEQFLQASGYDAGDFDEFNDQGTLAPAANLSWDDARAYVKWLNQTKPPEDSGLYRLPSEAEWEYACRANTRQSYCGSGRAEALGWFLNNSEGRLHNVASTKTPNGFGVFDLSGNVWEWVEDCWHPSYTGAPADARAWTTQCSQDRRNVTRRVLRGGSFLNHAQALRAANRTFASQNLRSQVYGLRVVREMRR